MLGSLNKPSFATTLTVVEKVVCPKRNRTDPIAEIGICRRRETRYVEAATVRKVAVGVRVFCVMARTRRSVEDGVIVPEGRDRVSLVRTPEVRKFAVESLRVLRFGNVAVVAPES